MLHIDKYLRSLEKRFGKPRAQFPTMDLEIEFKVQDITEMVRIIASSIFKRGMPRIVVGRVKSGGPKDVPAWIERFNERLPAYGTDAFRKTNVRLCFRNEFIRNASFQTVSFAITHELAHLVLHSVGEKTPHDEKYVDMLAMYFGFAEMYWEGRLYKKSPDMLMDGDIFKQVLALVSAQSTSVGYLSEEEISYACKAIQRARS